MSRTDKDRRSSVPSRLVLQASESSNAAHIDDEPLLQHTKDISDNDSALGSSSSPSNVEYLQHNYDELHGRTYHAYKAEYVLPNDEQEQDRLDMQHAIFMHIFDSKLVFAPICKLALHHALDLGTGTGLWAMEFADAHPGAHIIGTDLSPIQPEHVPPNCSFEIDDAEDEWLFGHKFDYIHARGFLPCLQDPQHVIQSAFDALLPGGYFEFQEVAFPPKYAEIPSSESPYLKWMGLLLESVEKLGRPWTNVQQYTRLMQESGFIHVEERKFCIPTGPWSTDEKDKVSGYMQLENCLDSMEALTMRLLTEWEPEECKILAAQVRAELLSGRIRPYNDVLVAWGRKPANDDDNTLSSS